MKEIYPKLEEIIGDMKTPKDVVDNVFLYYLLKQNIYVLKSNVSFS